MKLLQVLMRRNRLFLPILVGISYMYFHIYLIYCTDILEFCFVVIVTLLFVLMCVCVCLDLDYLKDVRSMIPISNQRRSDLYHIDAVREPSTVL